MRQSDLIQLQTIVIYIHFWLITGLTNHFDMHSDRYQSRINQILHFNLSTYDSNHLSMPIHHTFDKNHPLQPLIVILSLVDQFITYRGPSVQGESAMAGVESRGPAMAVSKAKRGMV